MISKERKPLQTDELLGLIFSDESKRYRIPEEPNKGDYVSLRIRVPKDKAERVVLMLTSCGIMQEMHPIEGFPTNEHFDFYETKIACENGKITYRFSVYTRSSSYTCSRIGVTAPAHKDILPRDDDFTIIPGFHVPEWAKNAVMYQIFTDRFCNGDMTNDVVNDEYYYAVGHAKKALSWDTLPIDTDFRHFYGGDIQGILDKLDYIESLGVEVIYLNPIFVSPSSHKYDTQDYDHIDPHFGVITDDLDHKMQSWEKHNGYAPKYIRRIISEENLTKSDALFARLCEEIHNRGMRIILDGVFNHCGSFNKWMDREGIYFGKSDFPIGAYRSESSPYRSYFRFGQETDPEMEYEGWWGYPTLPKLNYEESEELKREIFRIAEKWLSPPYNADGWRLDVAADLGHSLDYNHKFWAEFRTHVKRVKPDALILSEHYGDPSPWLLGNEWDTVMNYDAFMEPVTYFLTGMEKHSDEKNDVLYHDGKAFFNTLLQKMARLPSPALLSAMNELSNHDHSRFLTRTNRKVGRITTVGSAAAGEGIRKSVMREAVVIQMTWPGSPTIYYGDEAGQVGFTDPDCRRTYPWGKEDHGMIALHRVLTALRRLYPNLKEGSLKPLFAADGQIAYARFGKENEKAIIVAVNAADEEKEFSLALSEIEAFNASFHRVLLTHKGGFTVSERIADQLPASPEILKTEPLLLSPREDKLSFVLPKTSAAILVEC